MFNPFNTFGSDYDEVDLDGSPTHEECTQVSRTEDYESKMRNECKVFISQLKRMWAERLKECHLVLKVKSNPHDFGVYYSVVARFHEDDEKSSALAWEMQDNMPEKWDDIAATELGLLTIPTTPV